MSRRRSARALALCGLLACPLPARGASAARDSHSGGDALRASSSARQEPRVAPQFPEPLEPDDPRARAARALERGLAFLAAEQARQPDGSFPQGNGRNYVPVALTALGGLAFMAAGHTPERGPYGDNVVRAVEYLIKRTDLGDGSATRGWIASTGDNLSRTHGHGFATITLAQAYSLAPSTAIGRSTRVALDAAIQRILKSQGVEGGWYYEPTASAQHENSVTVVMLQALRAARDVGIAIEERAIQRAADYILRCQEEDGSFRYDLTSSRTSVALTAAGISTLNALGRYEGAEIRSAAEFLMRELVAREERTSERMRGVSDSKWPFYERLYVAQALVQHPDERLFERWWPAELERLLAAQRDDGSWPSDEYGPSYATAINCLVLALPEGILPIFQR